MLLIETQNMKHSISRTGISALTPLALVSALSSLAMAPVAAQSNDDKTLAPVIVTASRFASDPAFSPIGAAVITSEQIREAGVGNINEAIRKIGGVYGRQNPNGSQDYYLDLRGFGESSAQNMVVMVDGIRLSEVEQANVLLTSIPIESVERIEIVRGGSSVLYGEGATGGTIQVITKRADRNKQRGTVFAEAGSYGHRELRASVAKGWEGFSLDANVSTQRADNYRDNNESKQKNFSGGLQWASNEGRAGIRVDAATQDSRFPGALFTLEQFKENPRQTNTPNDFGSYDLNRYTAFIERRIGAFDIATELSHREKSVKSFFDFGPGSTISESKGRMTQLSPRVRHLAEFGGLKNELVVGMDFFRSARTSDSTFLPSNSTQDSKAIYARNEIRSGKARFALGARHEIFDKDADQGAVRLYNISHSLNAWDIQGSYAVMSSVNLFAKAGQSYRVANVDDNNLTAVSNQPLAPQTSHDLEVGAQLGTAARKMSVKLFQHRLKNEIFFDPTSPTPSPFFFGANVNLDPTRREGIEVEASTRLMSAFTLSGILQHVSAKFAEGPNEGREVPLVPRNTATVRLNWMPGSGHSADIGMQWVDSQRYGGDFSNTCTARIPSYTTLDARYAKRVGAWELAIAGANLTGKDYFTQAYACQGGIYPESGRQVKVSARLEF